MEHLDESDSNIAYKDDLLAMISIADNEEDLKLLRKLFVR